MSVIKRFLEIMPTKTAVYASYEQARIPGFKCVICGGSGLLYDNDINNDLTNCRFCKGTGLLEAIVTIEWKEVKYDNTKRLIQEGVEL
ncbi:MAG: hypothetical protein IJ557_02635 [Bacteroidaceae bacterium]|nr:hypothetical protein [Bacteroidaceae bacterium]